MSGKYTAICPNCDGRQQVLLKNAGRKAECKCGARFKLETISAACPHCSRSKSVPIEFVGRVAVCKCGNKFRLELQHGKEDPTEDDRVAPPPPEVIALETVLPQEWHVSKDGQQHGPFTLEQIKHLAETGQFETGDLVWREGTADWVPPWSVKGLYPESTVPDEVEDAKQRGVSSNVWMVISNAAVDLRGGIQALKDWFKTLSTMGINEAAVSLWVGYWSLIWGLLVGYWRWIKALKDWFKSLSTMGKVGTVFVVFVASNVIAGTETFQWHEAKSSNTIVRYEEFIAKYPQSQRVEYAQNKIRELKVTKEAARTANRRTPVVSHRAGQQLHKTIDDIHYDAVRRDMVREGLDPDMHSEAEVRAVNKLLRDKGLW